MLGIKILNRYDNENSVYVKLYLKNGKVVDEHRYIMSNYLNRELSYNDVVHHKDGNKKNNNISNLELLSRSEHASEHQSKTYNEKFIELKCSFCNNNFYLLKTKHRYEILRGREDFCCSISCSVKRQWVIKKEKQQQQEILEDMPK